MNSLYKAYIDFIKYAIEDEADIPDSAKCIDWYGFLQFCNRHGIIGLVFEGIQKADLRINQNVLFQWLSYSEKIKRQNQITNLRIGQVRHFFEELNWRSCILKGQANGLMYPKPEVRSPGDIDIWVERKAEEVINLVLSRFPGASYSLHHIKMPIFKDISVEVHYRPTGLSNWILDRILQNYIGEVSDRQFSHKEKLGDIEICCLTDDFNALYQILHMYGHFLATRNSFKQFVDYYYLLKKGLSAEEKEHGGQMIKTLKLEKYASGIMWIMKEVLGLDENYIIGEINEKEGKRLLNESMYYGTFSKNTLLAVLEQTWSNLRLLRYYPKEVMLSPIHLCWHQWWKLKMRISLRKGLA